MDVSAVAALLLRVVAAVVELALSGQSIFPVAMARLSPMAEAVDPVVLQEPV
jgi:hypothetical protein